MLDTCKQCEEITKILSVMPEYVKRLEKMESRVDDHERSIKELYIGQAETKVYVKQILDKLNGMEGNLFKFLRQITTDASTERAADRSADATERVAGVQERLETTSKYTELIKYVIGATIGAAIGGLVVYFK